MDIVSHLLLQSHKVDHRDLAEMQKEECSKQIKVVVSYLEHLNQSRSGTQELLRLRPAHSGSQALMLK